MARSISAICYVDFSGNLETTACGLPIEAVIGDADTPPGVSVYLSGVTCPGCRAWIQANKFELAQDVLGSSGLPVSATSKTSDRIRASV